MTEGLLERMRIAVALLLASLLVLVPLLTVPDGDAGLIGVVVALAVLAWAGHDLAAVRHAARTVTRAGLGARRTGHPVVVARQCDPDADGRPRPRAPGPLRPERVPA